MSITCVVGLLWGDEAKARVVDLLAEKAELVVRFQGGSNAGHTVVVGGEKYVFHLVPAGVLRPGKLCVIGNGVVVDPVLLLAEIGELEARGLEVRSRLRLSDRAQVVMPYHKVLDGASEKARRAGKLGTTLRGIGPAYSDKIARRGFRLADLINPSVLKERLENHLPYLNALLTKVYGLEPVDGDDLLADCRRYGEELKPMVTDTTRLLLEAHETGRNILLEGAQGALLDVDFGTYPYTTSSNASTAGVASGTGLPPRALDHVVGIAKAYATRVGEGPFPTELTGAVGEAIREKGSEYGATTGRPRRCGWLDLVALRYTTALNGVDALAVTKLDVLSGQNTLKLCTAYRHQGRTLDWFPADLEVLRQCEPVYEELPGWSEELGDVRIFEALPQTAQDYLHRLREAVGLPVNLATVGVERDQLIQMQL